MTYSNSVFSKLLRVEGSQEKCIKEKGFELFLKILEDPKKKMHLFLETLDSIKILLMKRDNLIIFKDLPEKIEILSKDND